jgi:enoyl-[acyl-carrier-protein] reductase (NADH)
MKSVNNFTYLKRLIEPEEIAGAVLFLASDEGSGMTGELIVMDAGYHLKS